MKLEQVTSPELTTTFSRCLLKPASITTADIQHLTTLSNQFPYCQVLHALVGRAALNQDQLFDKSLSKAALYSSDRNMLYVTINNPEILTAIPLKTNFDTADKVRNNLPQESLQPEDFITDANFLMVDDPESFSAFAPIEGEADAIIEEVIEPQGFDELNINTLNPVEKSVLNSPPYAGASSTENTLVDTKDSHAFNPIDSHEISKYDDDKMPFSFLWWLSKTRKEHSETYQPYLLPHLKEKQTIQNDKADNDLKHQIVEQIFHHQVPMKELNNEDSGTLTFKHKEEAVLDTFIRTAPQIKHPKGENISTENKARESSQDSNDLVSETLAKIYTRQMLLDKAIDTYKKLSLKFPQKSAYFTELICSLEKKINK